MTYVTAGIKVKRGNKTICYEVIDTARPFWKSDNLKLMEITQIIEDGADCYPWMEVRAWLPVKTITGQRVWGEKVFKRKVWVVWGTGFHMEPEVQYATFFDLIKTGQMS